ncbi:MAG TPA: right-handed parallel beta-helix repeat-containing protein, partial [Dongiaceae bacterium]|nr:right-handed parallel beta-helix repeat-containing protein [Dongiaceae bacterium]
ITRTLVLIPKNADSFSVPAPFPKTGSITVLLQSGFQSALVRGFHVAGRVRQANSCDVSSPVTTFENCRIDSGFTTSGTCNIVTIRLHGCLIFGGASLGAYYPDLSATTVVGGLNVRSHGNPALRGNYITDAPGAGVTTCCNDGPLTADDNTVTSAVDGFAFEGGGSFSGNVVRDCSGSAFRSTSTGPASAGPTSLSGNLVQRCGGHGVAMEGTIESGVRITGNRLEDVGGSGIDFRPMIGARPMITDNDIERTGSHGMWLETAGVLKGNRVLRANGVGIRVGEGSHVEGNVVGHTVAQGFLDQTLGGDPAQFLHNTAYFTGGAGYEIAGGAADSVKWNVAVLTTGYGLAWTGAAPAVFGCDDWYLNALGATSGIAPAASDLSVDPLFCDLAGDDVHLAAASPLLNAAGCGLIGALGQGCASPVGVALDPGGGTVRFAAAPLPARSGVLFSWGPGAGITRVEVFDLQGARRWSTTTEAGARSLRWDGRDERGSRLPAGVYFARRTSAGIEEKTRVVLVP